MNKDFYKEHPETTAMTEEDVAKFRKEASITVYGRCPKPILYFDRAGFPDVIMDVLKQQGFEAPTSIQSQGWPMALSGRNMIGIADTGSGKTLSLSCRRLYTF